MLIEDICTSTIGVVINCYLQQLAITYYKVQHFLYYIEYKKIIIRHVTEWYYVHIFLFFIEYIFFYLVGGLLLLFSLVTYSRYQIFPLIYSILNIHFFVIIFPRAYFTFAPSTIFSCIIHSLENRV